MANDHTTDGASFKDDMHRLGQGVDTLRTDTKQVAHGMIDAATSGAAELRHSAQNAVDAAKHAMGDAKESATDAVHSLKHLVVRHPVASLGIAAGVGMLAALVLFRPRI
jgi:ElaB/YqjD/DUF883 family membrane-anchored ribosome-binding protein